MSFHLKVKDALVLARASFDAGEMQICKVQDSVDDVACLYSAPCAIGAALPQALRAELDAIVEINGSTTAEGASFGICEFIHSGTITTDEPEDLSYLQQAHDTFGLDTFTKALEYLERKHGLRSMDGEG